MGKETKKQIWFAVGSQHLYGEETLRQVSDHSSAIVGGLNSSGKVPFEVVLKPVLTTSDQIYRLCVEAGADDDCIGIISWMHTFSPAKMWIKGLKNLNKPLLHLHTQYNKSIPWDSIDMDFMNLNQSAHGGREFGFINTRMNISRTVMTGFWKDEKLQNRIGDWAAVAAAVDESRSMKVARFGDNMRDVAVTEGNKVSAQIDFGYEVSGFGVGDLVEYVDAVSAAEIDELAERYFTGYEAAESLRKGGSDYSALSDSLRIELGIEKFLTDGGFGAFTTTFENLHGLKQLPGMAVQNLMARGYGFGGEGDWKTAALLRILKVMGSFRAGGTSFMEDYTYHFEGENSLVLGAHMLEVCPSIAGGPVRMEKHPLGIGGKDDPLRLVFNVPAGVALNATLIDLGGRFRLVVNELDVVAPPADLPRLPVARALWKPRPNLETSATAWIYAGGAHHSVFSQSVTSEQLRMFADITGTEMVLIDGSTAIDEFRNTLRLNEVFYGR